MDVHNAAVANGPKSNASSFASASTSRVPDSQRQNLPQTHSAAPASQTPTLPRIVSPKLLDAQSPKPSIDSVSTAKSNLTLDTRGLPARTSSPTATRESKASGSSRDRRDDDAGTDGNSEAETIVLSKDGSPSKSRNRKVIKHAHEDRNIPSGTNTTSSHPDSPPHSSNQPIDRRSKQDDRANKVAKTLGADTNVATLKATSELANLGEKRPHGGVSTGSQAHLRLKDTSSSLSSTPTSPVQSRNTSFNTHSSSDSDHDERPRLVNRSSSSAAKDRLRPPEKLVPHKRKAPRFESDDEEEGRKARRLRLASADISSDGASHSFKRLAGRDSSRTNGSSGKAASHSRRDISQNRSLSPQPRSHRRSHSTQLQSQSNGHMKKKRLAMPLQSTDYNSDDSSASGSPFVRSAKPRRLVTPAMTESLVSPAKIGPHKKHLDAHGQTFLARACARGEFELAKQRLEERPEDLNVADFAGNTPLQIAALNGYGNIVKLLIDAGCNLECVNHDKDTPLLDAVDNGHLEVVKLLLDAGVNPRKANLNGVEPLERVTDDIDNAVEIRLALVEAKKKIGERRFTSEEHRHENEETRSLYNPDSPRRSPAPPSASSRRAATGRATKTSNHLLYMPMDDKTLRLAAGRGDQQEVIRILQVRETFDDPEAMVAASRGGHDVVLQLLLALGKANPDPPPISSAPPEHATPILAAIGQENIKVVRLLLEQSAFDPCKRFEGSTYYELARQRQGPNWKEEEDILKKAYDHYKKTHGGKTKQHTRKDADSRHLSRTVEADNETSIRAHKRKPTSPSDERSRKKTIIVKTNTAHAASDSSTARHEDKGSHKRSSDHSNGKLSAKPRQRTDRSPSVSNHDAPPPKTNSRNFDSDSIAFSSEGEAAKPRRKKLVSGRELKDEKIREQERVREKQRRASIISSTDITPPKQPSSPSDLRSDDTVADKDKMRAEKPRDGERDRARQPKKERVKYAASEITGTRGRLSETPPHSSVSDEDTSEAPVKRRRRPEADYESDNGKRPSKGSAPPDNQPMKVTTSATYDLPTIKVVSKRRDDEDRRSAFDVKTKKQEPSLDRGRKDSQQLSVPPAEKTIHVKTESSDVEMVDVRLKQRASSNASASASVTSAESEAHRRRDGEKKRKKSDTLSHDSAAEAKKTEDGVQRRHRQEEEDEKRLKEERRKKERKRQEEEEAVRIRDEEKLKQRKKLEDEEKKKRQEEEEKQRQEAAKQKRKFEEEQRKMREEKEQLRQERLEKEAAEKARRKIEDDERQQRELEEQRRILAEKQAEEVRRRQLEEKERIRISRLPPLLQWLSTCPDPKFPSIAQLFKSLHSVRYDCINTDATGTAEGREGWLLNTQVALLLGEKDLGLTRFSSWQRLPASSIAKEVIWRVEADRYAMTDPDVYHLGRQLAGLYGGQDPRKMSTPDMCKLRNATRDKFLSTDMFFVKASDVMSVVPQFPHLRGIRLALMYRELPENEMQLKTVACTTKWKIDPDAAQLYGFAPGPKYYVDGLFVGQQRTGLTIPSRTPPEVRVPRRGLVCVPYDDPEFTSMCKDMGLDPFTLSGYASFIAKHRTGSSPSPEAAPNNTHDLTATASPASVNGSYDIQTARPSSPHSTQRTQEAVHINGVKGVNGVNGHSSLNGLHETSST